MVNEEVLFTPQMATVIVALRQEIAGIVHSSFGLSYLAFCLVASVRSHGGTMPLSSFSRNALAQENTVAVAAASAARLGYVTKDRCKDDRRVIYLSETRAGAAMLEAGFEAVYRRLRETAWRRCTKSDIEAVAQSSAAAACGLGVDPVEDNLDCHPVVSPASLMGIAALIRRWERIVRACSGLSFAEYRCLAYLEHRLEPLPCADVAEGVRLDRSSASALVSGLKAKGLVAVQQGGDRRSRLVSLTDRGRMAAALVASRLGDATAQVFCAIPSDLKAKVNELHMRMYATYCGATAASGCEIPVQIHLP